MNELTSLLTCVIGTLGFSVILGLPKNKLFFVGIGAFTTTLTFLICQHFSLSIFMSTFFGASFASIYSEIMARKLKTPSTVILLPTTIPLLPGGSLYYTMSYFINYDNKKFIAYAKETTETGFGIATGILVIFVTIKFIRHYKNALKNKSIL